MGKENLPRPPRQKHASQTRCSGASPVLQAVDSVLQTAVQGTAGPHSSSHLMVPPPSSSPQPPPPISDFPTSSSSVVHCECHPYSLLLQLQPVATDVVSVSRKTCKAADPTYCLEQCFWPWEVVTHVDHRPGVGMVATVRDEIYRFNYLSGTEGHGERFGFEISCLSQFLGSIGPLLAQKEGLLLRPLLFSHISLGTCECPHCPRCVYLVLFLSSLFQGRHFYLHAAEAPRG